MERYCIAGILEELQEEFQIGDDYAGLLQTAFILSFTICAPIFGYLGDNYSRRFIMVTSVLLCSAATLIGSFMKSYGGFFWLRACAGVGQSSFIAIAPTVIYDVTHLDHRKTALAVFYIAIPIGGGLGFMMASRIASFGGHWSWAMRVVPVLGVIGCILLCFTMDPIRGERERLEAKAKFFGNVSSYKSNILRLTTNRSYLLTTFGFMSITFVNGALAWWGPTFLYSGFRLVPGEDVTLDEVSLGFGILTVVAGVFGVPLGTLISYKLTRRYPTIDPIICAIALIGGGPLIVVALFTSDKSVVTTYLTVFIGQLLMNTTWTLVADILLSVVVPEARSTAEAFQILVSHALGDAGSPYLVGLLSELWKNKWQRNGDENKRLLKLENKFEAMRYALSSIVFMQLLGGILFAVDVFYIVEDRQFVLQAIANGNAQNTSANPSQVG